MVDKKLTCESCGNIACYNGGEYPDFCLTKNIDRLSLETTLERYGEDEFLARLMQASAAIDAEGYLKMTRVEETVEFIKRMDFKLVGIASCVSLMKEVRAFCRILDKNEIAYRVASCKIGRQDKSACNIREEDRMKPVDQMEAMCNPLMQAEYLASEGTDFNIVVGLCVGHDVVFNMNSQAPFTSLIVKDRVTCHSPAAPLNHLDGIYRKLLD